jgi:hypothetical protein
MNEDSWAFHDTLETEPRTIDSEETVLELLEAISW